MLVCLSIIYAYQRGKHDGKLEKTKEPPKDKVIYIQYGTAQAELWKVFHTWGIPISEEQKKGLIDAFTNCCYSKQKLGFGEGVAYVSRGANTSVIAKPAKDK